MQLPGIFNDKWHSWSLQNKNLQGWAVVMECVQCVLSAQPPIYGGVHHRMCVMYAQHHIYEGMHHGMCVVCVCTEYTASYLWKCVP